MTEYTFPDAVVTHRAVYFDGKELPWLIAQDGVTFKPGGSDDFNRLTVEFLVGEVLFRDPWEEIYDERWYWLPRNINFEFLKELERIADLHKEFL